MRVASAGGAYSAATSGRRRLNETTMPTAAPVVITESRSRHTPATAAARTRRLWRRVERKCGGAEENGMAEVAAATIIRAPLAEVYRVAKDVERFPDFMPDVESIRVLERAGTSTVTEWVGLVQGRKIRWVEEDHWNDAAHLCTFRQREGDFTHEEGTRGVAAVPEGHRTTIVLEYEMDLPLAGALLSNLLKVLVRKNLEGMLAALQGQLEGAAPAREGGQNTRNTPRRGRG